MAETSELTEAVRSLQSAVDDLRSLVQSVELNRHPPDLLTAPQVAELLGVSARTVEFWVTTKELRSIVISRKHTSRKARIRIRLSDLETFLESRASSPPVPRRQSRQRRPKDIPQWV